MVRADLLDDFLSQAEMLLDNGYHVPAASLAGAVLEDTLRRLCDSKNISYPQRTNIDSLNAELAKRDGYDKLVQKEITAKADLRNKADHGEFDKVKEPDVRDMVRWVRRFVTAQLQ
ncbi:MAG: HEPN domain-containing protein [Terriglobales bacterium]